MTIQILFFGISADAVGNNAISFEINSNTNVAQLKNLLQLQFPNLAQLSAFAVAVNEEYADDNQILEENNVVAVIPPVSGG
jgi:molybdopterin converting factor subunit 1